jgi:hypothetical protein
MNDQDRKNLISNIIGAMSGISGNKREDISIVSFAIFSVPIYKWVWQLLPDLVLK